MFDQRHYLGSADIVSSYRFIVLLGGFTRNNDNGLRQTGEALHSLLCYQKP